MTNYEYIKSMGINELAEFIIDLTNGCEYGCMYCNNYMDCECNTQEDLNGYLNGCKEWLMKDKKTMLTLPQLKQWGSCF